MPFVTAEELLDAARNGCYYGGRVVDLQTAQAVLDQTLQQALDNRQPNKYNRPWQLVDLTKQLDVNVPWIGFEFETGFDSNEDYKKFINFLWGHNHVAIDREGTGRFPVEVAFPPQVLAEVQAGEALLVKTLRFVHENGLVPALNPTTFTMRDVGIHAGISTPKFRQARAVRGDATRKLNAALLSLNDDQRIALYGRDELHWGGANNRDSYVEVKTFRAIPTVEHALLVSAVASRIPDLLDFFLDHPNAVLANAYAYLSGKDAAPKAK